MPFADPLRAGAGVPGLQRVPGMFGEMSAREFGSLPVTPLGGLSPILETFPSPTLASAWQMRTARWI